MSRRSRLHVPGGLYYVVQRGNARQPIFTDASDYATFEQLLSAMVVRCRTRVHAFYERLGYVGTGVRMVKTLSDS